MGWFDEQIKTRLQNDEESFQNAFADLSSVVLGKCVSTAAQSDDRRKTRNAMEEILGYYHVNPTALPDHLRDRNEQLEFLLHPSGIMRRTVKLEGAWYKDGIGALLGETQGGDVVAIIPKGFSGYAFFDWESGKKIRVTTKTVSKLKTEAVCFYRPFPLARLTVKDLFLYIFKTLSAADYLMAGAATLAITLLGLFTPYANQLIFSRVIPSGKTSLLISVAVLLLGVTVSMLLITITRNLILTRIQTKMGISVESAAMARLLSLPAVFFKEFSAGELSSRLGSVTSICNLLADVVLSTGLTSLFSLIYIGQIFHFAPAVAAPALTVLLATILFSIISALVQLRVSRRRMKAAAKLQGLEYALFSGIKKIKLAGAERRVFSKWAQSYKQQAQLQYNPPVLIKVNPVVSVAITLAGTIAIFYFAAVSGISAPDYMAFGAAYGMVSGSLALLASAALSIANIKPMAEMADPILKTEPEISVGKPVLTSLSGSIELNNVSFRYDEDSPLIIDDLSLKIRAGQYVAVVGATGCGKSTLMRLMLGFEKPQKGAVYYDGKDLQKVDLKSLRRNIGTVMQSGKLFIGDIYSNIVISAPWLTLSDAWEAAELAGIADDIRDMPMGMHTVISEGSGCISGGQRQRLLIARAIAPKPKILMFDEATSALDNLTQHQVSRSLDSLKSTRIVIAHRLSTIRQCDRIIVLDRGKIIEDGTYDELIAAGGSFAELVRRQRLDDSASVGKSTLY